MYFNHHFSIGYWSLKLSLQQPQCLRYIEVDGLAPEISPQGQYRAVGYSHKMISFQLDFQSGEYFGLYCMNLSLDLCHRYWRGRRFNPIKTSIQKNVKIKASPPKKQQTKNNKKYEMIWLHLCGGYRRRGGECIGCKSLRLPEVAILAGASKHIRTKQRRGHFNCKQHIV